MKDEIWILALAIGLFPTAVWYLLKWLGAPKVAMKKPVWYAVWTIAAIALLLHALSLLR